MHIVCFKGLSVIEKPHVPVQITQWSSTNMYMESLNYMHMMIWGQVSSVFLMITVIEYFECLSLLVMHVHVHMSDGVHYY